MKEQELKLATIQGLVDEFVAIAVLQGKAADHDDVGAYNQLVPQMRGVVEELKRRNGDQRRALTVLYLHENMQVRLAAARNTLAVAPAAARETLRAIEASRRLPQAADAGMALFALEEGIFKPA